MDFYNSAWEPELDFDFLKCNLGSGGLKLAIPPYNTDYSSVADQ